MSNLTRYEHQGFEAFIDNNGEIYTTVSGYSRLSGLSKRAINKRIGTGNYETIKTAEIPTTQGLRTGNLIPADLVSDWLFDDNIAVARVMARAGVRLFIQQVAGYDPNARAKQNLLTSWKEARIMLSDIEPSYQTWCKENKYSGSHTTNYIYFIVCEARADELKLLELVDGCPKIAANYIPTDAELDNVAKIKLQLTKYKRKFSDYKTAVLTAVSDVGI